MAAGHLSLIPGGGCRVEVICGSILLMALYDLAIGQFPVSNHSLLSASCVDESPLCDDSFLDVFLDFRFCIFRFSEKASKLNGPPGPKGDKLIVATFAAKGLNFGTDSGFVFSESFSVRGTIPFFP